MMARVKKKERNINRRKKDVKHYKKSQKLISTKPPCILRTNTAPPQEHEAVVIEAKVVRVTEDPHLLERARTQWQFGNWQSLAQLDQETIQQHPDRAKLALLAAAGRLQTADVDDAWHFIELARGWGCSKQLICQILAAGVHHSIGIAAAVLGQRSLANNHFESSIAIGSPGSDFRLLAQARLREHTPC